MAEWKVPQSETAPALAGFLRGRVEGSWKKVKQRVRAGAVRVDGQVVTDPGHRLCAGQVVSVGRATQRPGQPQSQGIDIVWMDSQVVVVDKPAGISTVPSGDDVDDTAQSRLRAQLGRGQRKLPPAFKVHRIDKATSGLVMFARTPRALEGLKAQVHARSLERSYLCVVHGTLSDQTFESWFVRDRGDGLRGSTRGTKGRRAVTHLEVVERLGAVTLCRCRLETGRTHQIRIHLAEAGHPLVGEPVYIRRFVSRGGEPVEAPRMMLHAAELGFVHPVKGTRVHVESPLPEAFATFVEARRHSL